MTRIFNSLLFAALFSLPRLSGAADITLDHNACNTRHTLAVGDSMTLRLPGNPTTGYAWETSGMPAQLNRKGEPGYSSDSRLIGAGGITTFSFTAAAAGNGDLELVYRRSWEKEKPPFKTCLISLSVIPAGKVR